jgi:phosphohistidine phosphatase
MTRTLWVVRHAKAVADPPPGGTDHDRPLAPRGRRDAEALGRRLAGDRFGLDEADLPDVVLCSTARRTRQTADGIVTGLAALAEPPAVDYRRALYYAGPDDVLAEVRTVPDDRRSVMVVGHNPTAHALAAGLGDRDTVADIEGAAGVEARGFPTCAVAVYRLPAGRWLDVAEGTGRLVGVFTPPY